MPKFTDNRGREWVVDLNVTTAKTVRKLANVDLLKILEGDSELLARLATDPILLVDVIYVLCKDQADKAGISDEEFGRAMAGDAIDGAARALQESLVLFPRSPKDRENLGRVMAATEAAMDQVRDRTTKELNTKLPSAIQEAVELAMSGDSSTSARGSSA